MTTADTEKIQERELVESWRFEELHRAGYPIRLANKIARRTEADLHLAVDLVSRRGCNPEVAARIVL